jgi:glycosyltransferase involved in cell wall biosynthesis
MRIPFLCKRRPQQRDLLARPYGRFHYLPAGLAQRGHDVRVALVSHSGLEDASQECAGVRWRGLDARTHGPLGISRTLQCEAAAFAPDWVVGCSDAWYGWLAHRIAHHTQAKLAVDAYDNYEAYMPWNFPLHHLWRRSIAAADVAVAAGPQLASLMQRHRRAASSPVGIVPMAADPGFVPMPKRTSREELGLPADAILVGYCGSWSSSRGTDVLIDAFRRVRAALPGVLLVLTGRPPAAVAAEPGVLATGYLKDGDLPKLINSLDLACIITANTAFGAYSYPAKLCEAIACEVPVVASATEPVRWMLGGDERGLAKPGNTQDLANRIIEALGRRGIARAQPPSWQDSAGQLESLLLRAS